MKVKLITPQRPPVKYSFRPTFDVQRRCFAKSNVANPTLEQVECERYKGMVLARFPSSVSEKDGNKTIIVNLDYLLQKTAPPIKKHIISETPKYGL